MMKELIEELEDAMEGSRKLDRTIYWSLDFPRTGDMEKVIPHYTTSLDDALTLVPKEWGWAAAELEKGVPSAVTTNMEPQIKPGTLESNPDKIDFRANAATPALALCIATLKARQAMEKTP
jgi:hypothetical protein